MKKIITIATCAVFALSTLMSTAQTDAKAAKKDDSKKEAAPAKKSEGKKLKKDGTPDKRYKENKEAKPATSTKKEAAKTDKK